VPVDTIPLCYIHSIRLRLYSTYQNHLKYLNCLSSIEQLCVKFLKRAGQILDYGSIRCQSIHTSQPANHSAETPTNYIRHRHSPKSRRDNIPAPRGAVTRSQTRLQSGIRRHRFAQAGRVSVVQIWNSRLLQQVLHASNDAIQTRLNCISQLQLELFFLTSQSNQSEPGVVHLISPQSYSPQTKAWDTPEVLFKAYKEKLKLVAPRAGIQGPDTKELSDFRYRFAVEKEGESRLKN
jgi:hypothetical protein